MTGPFVAAPESTHAGEETPAGRMGTGRTRPEEAGAGAPSKPGTIVGGRVPDKGNCGRRAQWRSNRLNRTRPTRAMTASAAQIVTAAENLPSFAMFVPHSISG